MIDRLIDRRVLLIGGGLCVGGLSLAGLALAGTPARAGAFISRRIAVSVRGTGRDVLLIPGLASGPAIWNRAMAAVPGYRWHLVQVRGFAGLPAEANATGDLIRPLSQEIGRYIRDARLTRPAVIGHSMGGTLALMLGLEGLAGRV
ncbi:MAG: alpha/beta fold hydrolase, partial [Sphingobium sp.]